MKMGFVLGRSEVFDAQFYFCVLGSGMWTETGINSTGGTGKSYDGVGLIEPIGFA